MTVPPNGAPTITPSAHQPAPKAAPVAAPPAAPAPELTAAQARIAELEQRLGAADKKLRVNGVEVMKVANEKKAMGAKLSEHAAYDKAFKAAGLTPSDLADFKVNPERVLKKALGDNYYDRIVELRLNGGAPTAEVVASEIARSKEEIRAELRAEAEAEKAAGTKAQQDREEQARAAIASEASAFFDKSKGDFPGLEKYQTEQVARAVAQFVESEFHRTGKVLTSKEAAEHVEWFDVSARFARGEDLSPKTIEKHRAKLEKLTEKLRPATVSPVAPKSAGQVSRGAEVERRTLSNDLTAATPPAKRTHRTDEERMEAIRALNLDRGA